jgi:nitrogenase subunit NifH
MKNIEIKKSGDKIIFNSQNEFTEKELIETYNLSLKGQLIYDMQVKKRQEQIEQCNADIERLQLQKRELINRSEAIKSYFINNNIDYEKELQKLPKTGEIPDEVQHE